MGLQYIILGSIDLFSGPLISLLYPMWCTYKAIENGSSANDLRPLLTYWIFYSIFASFEEIAIYPLIEWFPWWYIVKMVVNIALIIPSFKGSASLYDMIKPWIDRQVQSFSPPDVSYFKNLFNEIVETINARFRPRGNNDARPQDNSNTENNNVGPESESTSNNFRSNGGGYRLRTVTPTRSTFH